MAVQERPPQTRIWTYADYAALPDDGHRYQVIEGELSMVPAPGAAHQRIVVKLAGTFDQHVTTNDLGEILIAPYDVVLAERNIVQPDLLFISKERLDNITDANVQGAPDLVVEILSPGAAEMDKTRKRDLYARFGVREYWLVSPEAGSIEVLYLEKESFERLGLYGAGDDVKSKVLSDLSFNTDAVFKSR
jgi:Uma2 family endonuclease